MQRIAEALLKHGKQTLGELLVTCNFQSGYDQRPTVKREDIKTALLYLMQLNLVNSYEYIDENVKGEAKKEQQYEAALDRMLQIIRTPRFVEHILEQFPDQADISEAIITVLLEHGKLRSDQVVHQVTSDLGQRGITLNADAVRMAMRSLMYAHYVERAPPCDLPPTIPEIHPAAQKKRAAPKPGTEEAVQQAKEQDIIKIRSDWNSNRFTGNMEMLPGAPIATFPSPENGHDDASSEDNDDADEGQQAAGKAGTKRRRAAAPPPPPTRNKRGKRAARSDNVIKEEEEDVDEAGPSHAPAPAQPAILWRVNYDEFNRQFRNQEFLKMLAMGHEDVDVEVMAALLKASGPQEDAIKIQCTPLVGLDTIHTTLKRGGSSLTVADIKNSMDKMSHEDPAFVVVGSEGLGGEQYRANLYIGLDQRRNVHLLATIREKFGQSAARIWNMLQLEGQMEQKQVGDMAMLPKETAREALYSMLRSGYLQMQDVPRSADHAPSRTFYTWRANQSAAAARLAVDLYKAAGNVHKRLQHHMESNSEMTERVQMVAKGQQSAEVLQKHDFKVFRQVTKVLQSSLLRLDEQIALFNDM